MPNLESSYVVHITRPTSHFITSKGFRHGACVVQARVKLFAEPTSYDRTLGDEWFVTTQAMQPHAHQRRGREGEWGGQIHTATV